MKLILTVVIVLFCRFAESQNILPDFEQISNTFKIMTKSGIGTCFAIGDTNHTYIVTAKHMFPNVANGQKVLFEIDTTTGIFHGRGTVFIDSVSFVDVAVIKPDNFIVGQGIKVQQPPAGLGSDGYFLGFPFNKSSTDVGKLLDPIPIPLVKRCMLSGINVNEGIIIYLLDGQNNPGFSGGPVFFPMSMSITQHKAGLLGIVSGYYTQTDSATTPKGSMSYSENSGIMIVFSSQNIHRILQQNNLKE